MKVEIYHPPRRTPIEQREVDKMQVELHNRALDMKEERRAKDLRNYLTIMAIYPDFLYRR